MDLNPLTWPPVAKIIGIIGLVVAVGAGGITASVIWRSSPVPAPSASASTPPLVGTAAGANIFLCRQSADQTLIQWQYSNGNLAGTYDEAKLSGQAPAEKVNSTTGNITGTMDGSDVTLNTTAPITTPNTTAPSVSTAPTANTGSSSIKGTVTASQLTLNMPQSDGTYQSTSCDQAAVSDWNSLIDSLNSQAQQDNVQASQTAAQASQSSSQTPSPADPAQAGQAQQTLVNAVAALRGDASALAGNRQFSTDVGNIQQAYDAAKAEWQTEQKKGSCADGSMTAEASMVAADASWSGARLNTLRSDVQWVRRTSGPIARVQNELTAAQTNLNTLRSLAIAPDTDPSDTIDAGSKALDDMNNTISSAQAQGNAIAAQANQLATAAQNYAKSRCAK